MTAPEEPSGAPSPLECGLKGACPRCGARTLFHGVVAFADVCPACGLRFDAFNVGDGPAAFLTLFVGTLVTALAVWLELAVAPPWWVHVIVWVPVTAAAVIASLRVAKGVLLALEYRNAAREGKVDAEVRR